MALVLVVDDDDVFNAGVEKFLGKQGHSVVITATVEDAKKELSTRVFNLVLLDLMLPDGNGLELLDFVGPESPTRVVIATGNDSLKSFIEKLEGPNIDYLTKPIDLKLLAKMIDKMNSKDAAEKTTIESLMVGRSEGLQQVITQVEQVGPMDCTVFIRGESGTGKELVAESVHISSGRPGAFVPVNCGAITKELVSSELFGHEKGSFSGAMQRHTGFFERANDGTLFLDEITEMPIDMQTQLLRVLETGVITRVGGETEIEVNPRVIAATNRDPVEAIEAGKLREDLYFRLQVFPIEIPPLRERRDDILILTDHFLQRLNDKHSTQKYLEERVRKQLEAYDWPGNVRELKHAINRAFVMAVGDEIDNVMIESFDKSNNNVGIKESVGRSIAEMERELIIATLDHYKGDRTATAEALGVSTKTLYNRLREYEMSDEHQ